MLNMKSYTITQFHDILMYRKGKLTAVDIAHDNLSTFIGEESRCLGANALSRAGDNSCLAMEHAFGVVQVGRDLLSTCVRHGCEG